MIDAANVVLARNGIDLREWPGVYLVGGVASLLVQMRYVPFENGLDFIVPKEWGDVKDNCIRQWFRSRSYFIKSNENSGYVCLNQDVTKKAHDMQFFAYDNSAEEMIQKFDLAPCRVAIGAYDAFCTEDALYAFATGVCMNSCGRRERLQKYVDRGFDTLHLPESLPDRITWEKPNYSLMSRFHEALINTDFGLPVITDLQC